MTAVDYRMMPVSQIHAARRSLLTRLRGVRLGLTDCSSLVLPGLPSGSTGERSVGGSLAWEGPQSEDELCWGAGVEAAKDGKINVQ